MWPPFASCGTPQLLGIELIRLLIVVCGMLSHSSMAVRSCWILTGTGTSCCTSWSRASQTCSMGDMSGMQYAGHGRTETFSASRNCLQILATCSGVKYLSSTLKYFYLSSFFCNLYFTINIFDIFYFYFTTFLKKIM